ncbi:unnamed protein product [Sympodiomycopsis kandeliae]
MKVVGLLSGGKDSCYNLCHCAKQGHEIVALATLAPPQGKDELDSYMYQTVGHDAVHLVAEAMELPLYRHVITGKPLSIDQSFGIKKEEQDETEDLYKLLVTVKQHHPDVTGVSVGAILSNYQRFRVETICSRVELQLQPLAYLWQRSQEELLDEMVKSQVQAILIKVAGIGLQEKHLGKTLAQMQPLLMKLNSMYGAHVCGEGGEYETLTLDCPLFKKRIQLEQTEVVTDSESGVAQVAYLRIHRASLVAKDTNSSTTLADVIVPPVFDRFSQGILNQAVDVRGEGSSASTRRVDKSPKLPDPDDEQTSRPISSRRGKWVAFHNICARGSKYASREEEVTIAFNALKAELSKYDLSLPHCQHINLCLRDQSEFKSINAVYQSNFGVEPPSRATVAIPFERESDDINVILHGWAYDDESRYSSDNVQTHVGNRWRDRQALHVQGLSYWSSANIGPYSQGIVTLSRVSLAGQIGLLPVDLSLATEEEQYVLSIQHARRIFKSILQERNRDKKGWIEGGICWIGGQELDKVERARYVWERQVQSQSDDDDDEEDGDAKWLIGQDGVHTDAPSPTLVNPLPMLYVQVAQDALPRGAVVEWQLTGHDGRRQLPFESGEDEEDNTEADRPTVSHENFSIALESQHTCTASHQYIISATGQSSHGILTLNADSTNTVSSTTTLDKLASRLKNTVSVKIFVSTSSGATINQVQSLYKGILPETYSILPALGLWTSDYVKSQENGLKEWQVAIVWHGID